MLPTSRRRYPFKHHHGGGGGGGGGGVGGIGETNPRVAVQRTTSETIRIERDLDVTNTNGCKVIESRQARASMPCAAKEPTVLNASSVVAYSSSFVVTNVSPRQDYLETSDSPEPDSCSLETPSFSEDTQSYSRDLDDAVLIPTPPLPSATVELAYLAISDDAREENEADDAVACDGADNSHRVDGRYIGRFQVVKVESMGKFKRGRWHYQDYLDDSPHVPTDGYVFKDGCFVRNIQCANDNGNTSAGDHFDSSNASNMDRPIPIDSRIADIKANTRAE